MLQFYIAVSKNFSTNEKGLTIPGMLNQQVYDT